MVRSNNISFHTRLTSNNSIKVTGGSFGGSVDNDTVERLISVKFTVVVKPSGHPVFVDKEGREVSLYITVDPTKTEAGKAALKTYRQAQEKLYKKDCNCNSFDCCDCGMRENGCGCRYCWSCNACDTCYNEQ